MRSEAIGLKMKLWAFSTRRPARNARIYTPERPSLSLQWIVSTYQEIVLSLVPFQNLLHRHNWKTNCCPSRKRIVVHNCLPDRPPR